MTRGRAPLVAALALACLAALTAAASAAPLEVRIRDAKLGPEGGVRLTVLVTGDAVTGVLESGSFSVSEAGESVRGLGVEPLVESKEQPVAVALVMDVSGSTRGRPIEDARNAARAFVDQLPPGVALALVAFGSTSEVRVDFTRDRGAIAAAIDGLQPGGETALYDAVAQAAAALGSQDAQRNIVVFSDGRDTVRRTTLEQAVVAARDARAPVTSVGLQTPDFDPGPLERLAAETEGRTLSVGQSGELGGAFRTVAREIASQYVLTYSSVRTAPGELDLAVTVAVGDLRGTDSITVANPRVAPRLSPPPPRESAAPLPVPPVRVLASPGGLYVGIAAAFAAVALLVVTLVYRPDGRGALRVLRRGLKVYARRAAKSPDRSVMGSAFAQRAAELVSHVPKPRGFEERVQVLLDRAGWPLRTSELLVVQGAAGIGAAVLAYGFLGQAWLSVLLGLAGVAAPRVLLARQVGRRSSAFVEQLPDTLQLLSASLQAGYGLLQAIDTVTKESPPPTSSEFSRVLTEARLGMPVDEALDAMAERIGDEDFRWAVLAINIQRQVGGNLATLLQTVSETLREREQIRRQVQVLSAEGRVSALILSLLPFALAAYMAIVNPTYVGELVTTTMGRIIVAGVLGLLVVGIAWMRRLVRIEI